MKLTLRNKIGRYIDFNIYVVVKLAHVPVKDKYTTTLNDLWDISKEDIEEIVIDVIDVESEKEAKKNE